MTKYKFPKDEAIASLIEDASTEIDVLNTIAAGEELSQRELAIFKAAIVFKTRGAKAASSSPDSGAENRFDHDAGDLYDAVGGLDRDTFHARLEEFVKELRIAAIRHDGLSKSRHIEMLLQHFHTPLEIATASVLTKSI